MSPRLDPRLYVIRLAWLSRRPARKAACALWMGPRSVSERAFFFAERRTALSRWSRPFPWRYRS
jgi:hypothetical protein